MNKKNVDEYFLSKLGAIKEMPFIIPVPVYKIGEKMFGLMNIHEDRPSINLKNSKEENLSLRNIFEEIVPGYHMNKEHWNTIYLDGKLSDEMIRNLIDKSYTIVFNSLNKSTKKRILGTGNENISD
jgi:predicted DNA-binding protein (MmcQ/YjbR family)